MAQPQQTFTQWARTYNSRNNRVPKHDDWFSDGFLWKFVVLAGLSYVVWADKLSLTLSFNDQNLTGRSVKTSLLSLLSDEDASITDHKSYKLAASKQPKSAPSKKAENNKSVWTPAATSSEKIERMQSYVDRFSPVAIAEMHKFGIPASIILAQGILESSAGTSGLATQANNHFGMKCFAKNCPKGHCMNYADDTHKDFFMKFPNAWGSFRKHSEMLKNNRRYASLFHTSDYRKWAAGLSKAGYATDKQYGEKLINLIRTLHLEAYDKR